MLTMKRVLFFIPKDTRIKKNYTNVTQEVTSPLLQSQSCDFLCIRSLNMNLYTSTDQFTLASYVSP